MPRLSVIVAVHDVQAYVRDCLLSITQQGFDAIEVIAVDDASTDHSGAILDDLAGTDARIRVLHLASNVGLGEARNAGLAVATGDYVLFVDGDDWLAPGALAAVDARLAETEPDVLLFEYERVFAEGTAARTSDAGLFERPLPETFTLEQHPEFLNLLQVAWNKAYRRSFLDEHGLRFPPGFYEDTPWTYPVLVSARRISVLASVCYSYRQRPGSILGSSTTRHFEIFEQWERLWAWLDARPELAPWRPVLFDRMTSHFLTILRQGTARVPRGHHRRFFRAAASAYRAHLPEGYAPPGGLKRLRHVLFLRRAYFAFRSVTVLRALGRRLLSLPRRLRGAGHLPALAVKKALYHLVFRRLPLDRHLAVFAAYWYRGYSCSPRAVYEAMRELAPGVRGVWVVEAEHAEGMPAGVPCVVADSLRYYWVLGRAKYLVNNVNFPDLVKRPGSVFVQTHHGTTLKTMGADLRRFPLAAPGMDFDALMRRVATWDFSVSASRYSTETWSRAYPGDYEHLEVGLPRNDVFFGFDPAAPARIREALGLPEGKRVVLYAPTHREWQRDRFEPNLDLAAVSGRLPDTVFLVRSHYYYGASPALAELARRGLVVDVSSCPSIEELCLAADVLLTDYSSVMFDFANLGRPVVVYGEDWDTYVRVRGTYFDLPSEGPGPFVRSADELVEVLAARSYESEEWVERLKRFQARFCEFDDGHAAEAVVRRVFLGETR